MHTRTLLMVLLGVALATSAGGQTPARTFALHLKPADSRAVGQLTAILTSAGNEILRQEMTLPWSGHLPFDPAASETILSFESAALWAGPLALDGSDREVEVLPRAELVFQVEKGDKTEPQPPTITVEVASAPPALPTNLPATRPKEGFKLKKTRLACALAGENWRCPAPALALDLRLDFPGHVPHYVWNVLLEPGRPLDLGKLRFQKGASISGWVTVAEGKPGGVEISVSPSVQVSARESGRQALSRLEAVANERGFFQVFGVEPGGYRVRAAHKGLADTEVWPVDVRAAEETSLGETVHLDLPAKLEVHIQPPVGPSGQPWRVELFKMRAGSNTTDREIYSVADQNGLWVQEGLEAGQYSLSVLNADGEKSGSGENSTWHFQDFEIGPGVAPLFIDIDAVEIIGTFMAGDQPLAGRLFFGGFHGAQNVVMVSNEEGRFTGLLPRDGRWDLDAEIDGRKLPLKPISFQEKRSGATELEIRLPNTRIHGRVVHKGKPVEGARISGFLQKAGNSGQFDGKSDAEGGFDIRGLPPGTYAVSADSYRARASSMRLDFDVRDGADDPAVEIELEEFLILEGQVVAGGQPARSAPFFAILTSPRGKDSRQGQTDFAGSFRFGFQESTREILLIVYVPGFAWRLARLRPSASLPGAPKTIVDVGLAAGSITLKGPVFVDGVLIYDGLRVAVRALFSMLQSVGAASFTSEGLVLSSVTPGNYKVCLSDNRCREGALPQGGHLELAFDSEDKEGGENSREK